MKYLLHELHTIHANLTAMNGTGFLILDCPVIQIITIEKDFTFNNTSSLNVLAFYT